MAILAVLFMLIFPVSLTLILLVIWAVTKKKIFIKIIGYSWLGLLSLFVFAIIMVQLTNKKELKKKHYYGTYIVNRDYFKGPQTDWQYNHFRFEIKENDSIYFYETDHEKIVKAYSGTIQTTAHDQYRSERLIINMSQPSHHILTSNPTTYRSAWNFYLVFNSPRFYNVYFKKGEWKPLND